MAFSTDAAAGFALAALAHADRDGAQSKAGTHPASGAYAVLARLSESNGAARSAFVRDTLAALTRARASGSAPLAEALDAVRVPPSKAEARVRACLTGSSSPSARPGYQPEPALLLYLRALTARAPQGPR